VPPQNKPTPQEISACRAFLEQSVAVLARVRIVLALGRIAHETVVRAFKAKPALFPFAHGGRRRVRPDGPILFDSYHCSRYNTNTGVLTEAMFREVFAAIRAELDRS
jgi:uracil-DNA glycosylase